MVEQPKPLPDEMLEQRRDGENPWERDWDDGELDPDDRMLNGLAWTEMRLTDILISQDLGGNPDDDDYMDRVDEIHDVLRDGFTRQELIRMVIFSLKGKASQNKMEVLSEFRSDLDRLMNM